MKVAMSNLPELRFRDYKNSWGAAPLKESLSFISYGFTNPMPEADNGPYMVTAKEISDGKIRFEAARKTTLTAFEELLTDKSRPIAGDILLTKDGTLGRLAVAGNELFCINQSVAVLRPITTAIPKFLYQLLSTPKYQVTMLRNAGGSAIKHIYITVVDKMEIATPTIPEQRKIADFLTAVDGRIGQLIQKKALLVDYKKGVMQQLFTQAIRFKDDHGNDFPDWEEKKLGELCITITKGTTPTSIGHAYQDTGINFIKTENINKTGFIDVDSTPKISDDCHSKLDRSSLSEGDVLFSIAGTLGRTAIVQSKDLPANTNQALGIIRLKDKRQNVFITNCLNTVKMEDWVRKMVSVGAQPNLSLTQLNSIRIPFPCSTEQTKIADFLSSINRKIESVATQIIETQTFKRGLLQQMFV